MSSPLPDGELTSRFGDRRDPRDGRTSHHDGVDLAAARGTAVLAPASGSVKLVSLAYGTDGHDGKTVILDHGDGIETLYAHLDAILVKEGDEVTAGQTIGRVGSSGWVTGPHLHFEVLRDGQPIDPASVVLDLTTPPKPEK